MIRAVGGSGTGPWIGTGSQVPGAACPGVSGQGEARRAHNSKLGNRVNIDFSPRHRYSPLFALCRDWSLPWETSPDSRGVCTLSFQPYAFDARENRRRWKSYSWIFIHELVGSIEQSCIVFLVQSGIKSLIRVQYHL